MYYELMHEYIRPEFLSLVPVLYMIGLMLRRTKKVNNCRIPMILSVNSVVLTLIYLVAVAPI